MVYYYFYIVKDGVWSESEIVWNNLNLIRNPPGQLSRTRFQANWVPDPDPHVFGPPGSGFGSIRDMDPRIRIRIYTKMSWNPEQCKQYIIFNPNPARIPWWACWRSGGEGRAWTGAGEWRRGAGQHGSHSSPSASPAPGLNILVLIRLKGTGIASRDGCFLKNKKKYGDFCKYRTLMDKGEVTGYQIFLCCIVLKANIEKSRLKLIKLLQKPFVTVKGKFRQTFPAFNAGCAVQWWKSINYRDEIIKNVM